MIRRRGFSLIEVTVVLAVGAILLGLCAGLIQTLMTMDRVERGHMVDRTTIGRLGRQFRDHVWAALRAEPLGGGKSTGLKLVLPAGRVVEYRIRGGELVWTERDAGKVRRRETYRLPAPEAVRWELERRDRQMVVCLVLEHPPGTTSQGGSHGFRIEGVLGKDHRFEKIGDSS